MCLFLQQDRLAGGEELHMVARYSGQTAAFFLFISFRMKILATEKKTPRMESIDPSVGFLLIGFPVPL